MTQIKQTFSFIKTPQKCAREECQNLVLPENIHILQVSVMGDPLAKVYEYCSKSCMEKKLANVGAKGTPFENVYVVGKPRILSERNPFKMEVLLKIEEPKIVFMETK